jgi:TolA-binding protein
MCRPHNSNFTQNLVGFDTVYGRKGLSAIDGRENTREDIEETSMRLKKRFTLTLVLLLIPCQLMAKAKDKNTKKNVEKVAAPTIEDFASFFAKKQEKGATPAVLKHADELSLKTIESINSLLDSPRLADAKKFELLLRLGETYIERHDYLRGREIEDFTAVYDGWQKSGATGKAPEINHSASRQEMTKGVNSFRKLVTEFPKHPRTDAALFALAETLSRLGNDNATMYYQQLLKTYPDSPLVPDAYLALGEHYFDRFNIPKAINNYKSAMKYKENKAYPYSVYKLGWAYYNAGGKNNSEQMENYKKSVAAFKLVIKLADLPQYEKGAISLKDEAIKDLILVWADAADVDSAWAYFQGIGASDMFYKMLERLGYIYVDQGKNKDAIKVFTRLLKESPLRETNPSVQAALAELYDLGDDPEKTVATLKIMQKLYLGKTAWVSENTGKRKDKDAVADASEIVRKELHRFATMYHTYGQKNKAKSHLLAASSLYAVYLESFPETEAAYEIRFYLAEILYSFKEYEAATEHYLIVSHQKPDKYRREAAKNAVSAMNTFVSQSSYPKLPERGHVTEPLTIPKEKLKLVEAIDNFVKLLPDDKDTAAMKFTAGDIMFDYGYYVKAMDRFAEITKSFPGSKQSDASVKLIIAYQLDREAWPSAIEWSKRFIKQSGLLDKKMEEFVRASLRTSLFKHGLALEKSNQRKEAAKAFMDFQREFPKDSTADKALFNASVNFYKLGELDDALSAGQLLLDKYPDSEVRPDVMLTVGQTYEATADFANAATFYLKFATDFPKDKRAPGTLFNAGVLLRGLDQLKKSELAFKQFIKAYPTDQFVEDALFQLAEVEESDGKIRESIENFDKFAKLPQVKDQDRIYYASVKSAVLMTLGSNVSEGRKNLENLQTKFAKSTTIKAFDARRLLAQGLFNAYERDMTEYARILIDDGTKIEAHVALKNAKLMDLATKYQGIIALGSGEYTVACLYRLGELHEDLAAALFKAPAAPGASQGDIDKFRSQLEKVAFPLREDANKYFETAYNKSKEVDTFTEWTEKTQEKMVELQPQKYKKFDVQAVRARYLSHRVQLTDSTKELAN